MGRYSMGCCSVEDRVVAVLSVFLYVVTILQVVRPCTRSNRVSKMTFCTVFYRRNSTNQPVLCTERTYKITVRTVQILDANRTSKFPNRERENIDTKFDKNIYQNLNTCYRRIYAWLSGLGTYGTKYTQIIFNYNYL